MTIFLIGSMGVGKSSLGKAIAAHLALPHMDTDDQIVAETSQSINEIFAFHGEPYFRALESKVIHGFDVTESCVISTGGGLPVTPGNMDYMLQNGVVVYLTATLADIVQRLYAARDKRPAIKSLNMVEIQNKLADMQQQREPIYEKAHLEFSRSTDLKADALALSTYLKMFI